MKNRGKNHFRSLMAENFVHRHVFGRKFNEPPAQKKCHKFEEKCSIDDGYDYYSILFLFPSQIHTIHVFSNLNIFENKNFFFFFFSCFLLLLSKQHQLNFKLYHCATSCNNDMLLSLSPSLFLLYLRIDAA